MEFAQCLAARLHCACLAREVLVQAAERIGVPEETLLAKFEKSAGVWERLTANRRLYVIAVQSALADACASGALVYHGHAGHLLLRGISHVLSTGCTSSTDAECFRTNPEAPISNAFAA